MHNASERNTTPEINATGKQISLWDVARFFTGVVAGILGAYGAVRLIILSAAQHHAAISQAEAAQLSAAVAMTICGLVVAWLVFGAQRAADKRAEQRAEQQAIMRQQAATADQLDAVVKQVETLAGEVHSLIDTQREQQAHAAKARTDLARIGEGVTDLRLGLAEMAQRMPAEESLLNHLKAYIDALFKALKDDKAEAVKEAKAEGFLDSVRGRLNGMNGSSDLRLVRGVRED